MEQDQDGIGHLGRQGLIIVHVFDAMEDFRVGQVLTLVDEGLTNLIVRLIVEVFGSKSSRINGSITRISCADQMLLNQVHAVPPRVR